VDGISPRLLRISVPVLAEEVTMQTNTLSHWKPYLPIRVEMYQLNTGFQETSGQPYLRYMSLKTAKETSYNIRGSGVNLSLPKFNLKLFQYLKLIKTDLRQEKLVEFKTKIRNVKF